MYHTHLNQLYGNGRESEIKNLLVLYKSYQHKQEHFFYLGQVGTGPQYQNRVDHRFKHKLKNILSLKNLENIIFGNMIIFYQNSQVCPKIHITADFITI